MRFLGLIAASLLVTFASGCTWDIQGTCTTCTGQVSDVSGTGCSYDAALTDAQKSCPTGTVAVTSFAVSPINCDAGTSVSLEQVQSTARDLLRVASNNVLGVPAPAAANCGPFTIHLVNSQDFTVVLKVDETTYDTQPVSAGSSHNFQVTVDDVNNFTLTILVDGSIYWTDTITSGIDPSSEEIDITLAGGGVQIGINPIGPTLLKLVVTNEETFTAVLRVDGTTFTDQPIGPFSSVEFLLTIDDPSDLKVTILVQNVVYYTNHVTEFVDAETEEIDILLAGGQVDFSINPLSNAVAAAKPKGAAKPQPDLAPKPDPKFSKRRK